MKEGEVEEDDEEAKGGKNWSLNADEATPIKALIVTQSFPTR